MRSLESTSLISSHIEGVIPTVLAPNKKSFSFKLAVAQQSKLRSLCAKYEVSLDYPQGEGLTLLEALAKEVQQLSLLENKIEKSADKLLVKQYQLAIIQAFEEHLRHLVQEPLPKKEIEASAQRFWQRFGYGLLLTVGLAVEGIGSFLGVQELICLIPSISSPLALAIELGFSLINAALFYYFESSAHKQAIGIDSMDELGMHLGIDEEEITRTSRINDLMFNPAVLGLSSGSYASYARLAGRINQTMRNKKQFQEEGPSEKTSHKILRYLLLTFSAAMAMVNSVLIFATPALIATPLGWALLFLGVGTMLTYHLFLREKAIVNTLNPSMQKLKDVKAQYEQFKPKKKADFVKAQQEKRAQQEIQMLRAEVLALKKEKMELAGKLIEGTVRVKTERVAQQMTSGLDMEAVLFNSHKMWKKPPPVSQRLVRREEVEQQGWLPQNSF